VAGGEFDKGHAPNSLTAVSTSGGAVTIASSPAGNNTITALQKNRIFFDKTLIIWHIILNLCGFLHKFTFCQGRIQKSGLGQD
jgi:hypothetical protein